MCPGRAVAIREADQRLIGTSLRLHHGPPGASGSCGGLGSCPIAECFRLVIMAKLEVLQPTPSERRFERGRKGIDVGGHWKVQRSRDLSKDRPVCLQLDYLVP